uniref:Uncharacterized protein n=1 Tax=Anopheles farauti TaxID=69004 RepID=A0A182QMX1_9DIPT
MGAVKEDLLEGEAGTREGQLLIFAAIVHCIFESVVLRSIEDVVYLSVSGQAANSRSAMPSSSRQRAGDVDGNHATTVCCLLQTLPQPRWLPTVVPVARIAGTHSPPGSPKEQEDHVATSFDVSPRANGGLILQGSPPPTVADSDVRRALQRMVAVFEHGRPATNALSSPERCIATVDALSLRNRAGMLALELSSAAVAAGFVSTLISTYLLPRCALRGGMLDGLLSGFGEDGRRFRVQHRKDLDNPCEIRGISVSGSASVCRQTLVQHFKYDLWIHLPNLALSASTGDTGPATYLAGCDVKRAACHLSLTQHNYPVLDTYLHRPVMGMISIR